jgi:polysaccharide biosynthesis/export protein
MRSTQVALLLSTAILSGLLALNLRAQFRTQEKLDALTAAMAEPQQAAPAPTPAAMPAILAPEKAPEPRECDGRPLPQYIIEPPDVLLIEAVLKDPKTGVTDRLPTQPISGSFLVRPDGTVGLGVWGSAVVTGLTEAHAITAIRQCLLSHPSHGVTAENLVVVVDVQAYNSKRYYVITKGAGDGDQVQAFPQRGPTCVLDAISMVSGLEDVGKTASIRLVRNRTDGTTEEMPVDWLAITQQSDCKTNYLLHPGDRLYVTKAGK